MVSQQGMGTFRAEKNFKIFSPVWHSHGLLHYGTHALCNYIYFEYRNSLLFMRFLEEYCVHWQGGEVYY